VCAAQMGGFQMDRDRFDALTRLLGSAGSRRAALGAALGATLGGSALGAQAKKGKSKKKKNKKKAPQTCFGTLLCEFPSDGLDFENCDLSGTDIDSCDGCNFRRADLSETDLSKGAAPGSGRFQGVSFRNANLSGANLEEADVSGASFRDACLSGANFFGANTDGADFRGAIFCGTILTDGTVDDSGCDDRNDCCLPVQGECTEGCVKDVDCPEGQTCCDDICCGGVFSCEPRVPEPGDVCVDTGIGGCDFPCVKDADCPSNWACIDDEACEIGSHCHPLCSAVDVVVVAGRRRQGH
jgi:hypothetical protein